MILFRGYINSNFPISIRVPFFSSGMYITQDKSKIIVNCLLISFHCFMYYSLLACKGVGDKTNNCLLKWLRLVPELKENNIIQKSVENSTNHQYLATTTSYNLSFSFQD